MKKNKKTNTKEEKTRKHATQLWHQSSLTQQIFVEETVAQREDDAAVVDYVEEQLDVEAPERIVVGTHVEIDTRGNALGTVAQLRRTSVPSLTKQARPCTPDFGPGTSAPRLLERGLGHIAFSLYRIRAGAPNGTPPTVRGPATRPRRT